MATARQRSSHRLARRQTGFDFTLHVRRLCDDIVTRLEPLAHVDMPRVAVSYSQTRKATRYGMHASLTAMRFAEGARHTIRRGQKWGVQSLHAADGREILYILIRYSRCCFCFGFFF